MFRDTAVADVLIVVPVISIFGSPETLQLIEYVEEEKLGEVLIQKETFEVAASSAVPFPFNVASTFVMLLGAVV